MIEHVSNLLGAYLDGELAGLRQRQVEQHLQSCAACRKELEELQQLSSLLQDAVPANEFKPADRFAAALALQLNARAVNPRPERKPGYLEFLGLAVPLGLLASFGTLLVLATAASLLGWLNPGGVAGNLLAWLQRSPDQTLWYTASLSLFGAPLPGGSQAAMDWLNRVSVFGVDVLVNLAWQAGFVLVYAAWMVIWLRRNRRNADAYMRVQS